MRQRFTRFFRRHAFALAQLAEQIDHFIHTVVALRIDNFRSVNIETFFFSFFADLLFIPQKNRL